MTSNNSENKFFGKYRGVVVNNVDPKKEGRLLVQVPDVMGLTPSSWAMPCVPLTGIQSGVFNLPAAGSNVWIEFEQGDPNYPIWVGGFWGSAAEIPTTALTAPPALPIMIMENATKDGLVISDTPVPVIAPLPIGLPVGGIVLKSGTSYIRIDKTGISVYGPKVTISSSAGPVDVNSGALTILGPGAPT